MTIIYLVFHGKTIYFDTKIPFGIRTGAMAAHRTTNALMFIYQKFGYSGVNYIDDIGCAEVGDNEVHGYNCLVDLTERLGFTVASAKCCAQSTKMTFCLIIVF